MLRYLVVVGAGCAVVALFLPLDYGRPEAIDYPLIVPVAVVVGAAIGALRGWRVLAAVAAAVAFVAVVVAVVVDVRNGLPARDLPVLAVGALAVAVGAVGSGSGAPWRKQLVGVVAGVVVAGVALIAPGAADAAAAASVVGAAGPVAEVAERPGGRRWEWQPGAPVTELVAAGRGVAAGLENGVVVGLNGADGTELWRYERPGARVGGLVASADRRTVLALYKRGQRPANRLLVVFDAVTGAVRFERVVDRLGPGGLKAGANVYVVDDNSAITAHDLATGEVRWQWTGVEECGAPQANIAGVGRERVSLALDCGDRLAVVGLDENGGEERWRHEVPLVAERLAVTRRVEAEANADGSVLVVEMSGQKLPADAITNGLVDTATGKLVRLEGPASKVVVTAGPRPLIRDQDKAEVLDLRAVDPDTGATTALDIGSCPITRAETTTAHTYLRICFGRESGLTVVTQDLAGGPASAIPLGSFGAGSGIDARLVAAAGGVVLAGAASWKNPIPIVGFAP